MYTFNPVADIPVDHNGFAIVVTFCVIALVINLFVERESFFVYFFIATVVSGFAYCVSYQWTNQEPKTFVNEKVIGKFVNYQPEGFNEEQRSGKTVRRVDVHFMYVVYEVNGSPVILKAKEGTTYPKEAVLYKN